MTAAPFTIYTGDALAMLKAMPDESVDCCVTSPPYYGLRDYGHADQIGAEPTLPEFIERLTAVFREVRRVLKPTGTCWVNMGDTYASSPGSAGRQGTNGAVCGRAATTERQNAASRKTDSSFRPKNLMGVPWRLAFALQDDGWFLRQDIVWNKPNPMPESVTDRCTKSHEYVFLLTKSARYYWNREKAQEPAAEPNRVRNDRIGGSNGHTVRHSPGGMMTGSQTRNRRSVWTLTTYPTPEAHFATFPAELPELCIAIGTPPDGVVLDPFNGAGTTGLAALKTGRRYVGIELNPEYVVITKQRVKRLMPLFGNDIHEPQTAEEQIA